MHVHVGQRLCSFYYVLEPFPLERCSQTKLWVAGAHFVIKGPDDRSSVSSIVKCKKLALLVLSKVYSEEHQFCGMLWNKMILLSNLGNIHIFLLDSNVVRERLSEILKFKIIQTWISFFYALYPYIFTPWNSLSRRHVSILYH